VQSATSAYSAPVLGDQGPIGRPGTARPIPAWKDDSAVMETLMVDPRLTSILV
jgi:hypothetical protein